MIAIPAFIVVISVIVVIHELGHYWMARAFKTKIDAFSVGFGHKLFGWTDKLGTEWKICLLPLGGFVKFHGDENASSVPDQKKLEELKEQMRAEGVDPYEIFHFKPLYQRTLVVFAGPLANFILALVIFLGFFSTVGEPTHKVMVGEVLEGTPAEAAGLEAGDQILRINGWKLYSYNDLQMIIGSAPKKPLRFELLREGMPLEKVIAPEARMVTIDDNGRERVQRRGQIGIQLPAIAEEDVENYRHGPGSAIMRGVQLTMLTVDRTFLYLGQIVTRQAPPDQLSGPLRIAKFSGDMAKQGVASLVLLIASISVSVGLINLFPIPILDGGHLLFYAIEAIQGRPLSLQVQEVGFKIGLAVLALLFIFVTWNDILYLLPGSTGAAGSPN